MRQLVVTQPTGRELSKHSAVISSVHHQFVKAGKLGKDQGKVLNWLFELRGVADYVGMEKESAGQEVARAIEMSEKFVTTVREMLETTGHES